MELQVKDSKQGYYYFIQPSRNNCNTFMQIPNLPHFTDYCWSNTSSGYFKFCIGNNDHLL